ncbi:MAG: DUF4173 domain-containing protein [Gaiellaceae bacterium]
MRIAVLAAATAAAALLPGSPLGIGVPLVAVLVAAAVATAARSSPGAIVFGSLALALAALAAVRDAGWVVALDLAAAWLLASVAVAGPTLAAAVAPLLRLRDVATLAPPVPQRSVPVLRGAALGGLVVVPFGALFWSADAVFAELGRGVPLPALGSLPGRALAFCVVFAAAGGLALAAHKRIRSPEVTVRRHLALWEWALPLALLDALFAVFVAVQVAVSFGGHEHVLGTAGLTYAEYAREGFWQLLAAAALTLTVIGGAVLFAATPRRADRLVLRLLLGILCAFTIVVLVSALSRLRLYEEAFGLTRLRLLAEAVAVWLGAFFALLLTAGLVVRLRRVLAPVAIAGTGLALLVFSLLDPDGLIAQRNVERWRDTGGIDLAYLRTLSADAAPELASLPPTLRASALGPLRSALAADEPWSSFNLSRTRARGLLDD